MSISQVNVSLESVIGTNHQRQTPARRTTPSLRSVGGRLVVNTGSTTPYALTTLDGRVVRRGVTRGPAASIGRSASGVYLLQTPSGRARTALTR